MTRMNVVRRGRVLALAAAATLVLSGCNFTPYSLPLPGGADLGNHPYTVKAEFRDAMDLVPQGGVRSSDVTVGRIKSVELKRGAWVAIVTMEINGDTKLPDNTEATIRQTSLLGEKFVSLDAPKSGGYGQLSDGDVIGLDHSGRNPELEEVLAAAAMLFNGGGLDKINTITRELNNALDGRETDIRELIDNTTEFTQILDRNKYAILGALSRIDRLAVATNKQKSEIDDALRDVPPALKILDKQRNDLVKMLKSLNHLGDVATGVIRRSKADTIRDLRLLQPVLKGLADAGDSLVGILRQLPSFPFPDMLVGNSVARAEAACPNDSQNVIRHGACFGDYINLDVNLSLNATQAEQLLLGILSLGGYHPAAASMAMSQAPTAQSTTPPAPTDALKGTTDKVTGSVSDLTGTVAGLLGGGAKPKTEEPQKQSGGLVCGILGLCRSTAVSFAEAQQTDLGQLLVGPAVAE